jgi:acyl carrier protein
MNQVDDVKREIQERIKQTLGVELTNDEQHFFLDAGIDSLAFLNVVQALEKKYVIKFNNDTLPDLANCSLLATALVDLVERKRAAG